MLDILPVFCGLTDNRSRVQGGLPVANGEGSSLYIHQWPACRSGPVFDQRIAWMSDQIDPISFIPAPPVPIQTQDGLVIHARHRVQQPGDTGYRPFQH